MFNDNLISLRKLHKMSQETLAEKLDVSRQTVSKWETGESMPDLDKAKKMAQLFNVTLDDLVTYDTAQSKLPVPPKGKHIFGTVTVGEKGQIVIPAKARKIFDIRAGDQLVILGDEDSGIAILKEDGFLQLLKEVRKSAE